MKRYFVVYATFDDQDEEHYSILYFFQTYLCGTTVSDTFAT